VISIDDCPDGGDMGKSGTAGSRGRERRERVATMDDSTETERERLQLIDWDGVRKWIAICEPHADPGGFVIKTWQNAGGQPDRASNVAFDKRKFDGPFFDALIQQ
jgi:hypothetical protein